MNSAVIRGYHIFSGFVLFVMSTGLATNLIAVLLIPVIFPLRPTADRFLLIFVAVLTFIGIAGILSSEHSSLRALAFPATLLVAYFIGRRINSVCISVFAVLVLLEVLIAIPLWLKGIFSPFSFIDTPFSPTSTSAHREYFYYWKTAGLSANSSLFALKLIVLVSLKSHLMWGLQRIFPFFYIIILLTTSRTLILGVLAYWFLTMPKNFRLVAVFGGFTAGVFFSSSLLEFLSLQFFRGYAGILDEGSDLAQNQNRFVYWIYGLQNILSSPFFGALGDTVKFFEGSGDASRLHSVFIQLAADYGLVALLLWCIFMIRTRHSLGYSLVPILVWQAMNQSYLGVFAFADVMLFAAISARRLSADSGPPDTSFRIGA